MRDQFMVNAVGPAMVLKHAIRLVPRRQRGAGVCARGGWWCACAPCGSPPRSARASPRRRSEPWSLAAWRGRALVQRAPHGVEALRESNFARREMISQSRVSCCQNDFREVNCQFAPAAQRRPRELRNDYTCQQQARRQRAGSCGNPAFTAARSESASIGREPGPVQYNGVPRNAGAAGMCEPYPETYGLGAMEVPASSGSPHGSLAD